MQLLGVGGVAQEFPQPAACVPAEPKACSICCGVELQQLAAAAAAAIVPAVPVVWKIL